MEEEKKSDCFKSSDGSVWVWVEQGTSAQVKVIRKGGDPVEMSEAEAQEMMDFLKKFKDQF